MSRAIPATRPCAETCSGRIEIRSSPRAAALAFTWVAVFVTTTLVAVALPLPARIAICVCAATACIPAIRASMLLGGRRAVRTLYWSESGLRALVGDQAEALSVRLAPGSFRFGRYLLLLRLQTCDGLRVVIIDGGKQGIRSFRRLCRYLESRRHVFPGQADTIQPQDLKCVTRH